ncbi:hypothetical protein ACDP63_23170 [Paracoccus sp. P2]|uniref:AMP-binding enzyme n=1 Tax=Paracoccus TaxID=265 RepID=UPI000465BF8D|nr:AMP-binding enzyme C-terminal domain-containing protein [Paracoccus pantotrophus]
MIELCGPNVFKGYWRMPEKTAAELPGVAGSAVIGLPHRDFGEGVTAAVVPTGSPALAEAELLTVLKGLLAKFKQPKRMLFLDELPRNTMGKVQKNLLRDRFAGLYDGAAER